MIVPHLRKGALVPVRTTTTTGKSAPDAPVADALLTATKNAPSTVTNAALSAATEAVMLPNVRFPRPARTVTAVTARAATSTVTPNRDNVGILTAEPTMANAVAM